MSKLIIAVLALVAAIGVFVGYVKPTYDNIQSIKVDVSKFDEALTKANELQELKQGLLSRYNTFSSEDRSRLHRLLPDHVDNVRLVLDLDNMASRYGMAVQNVLISGKDSDTTQNAAIIGGVGNGDKKYDSLTLQFNTVATYKNFVSFIEDLESALRIVDLVSLNMEPIRLVGEGGTEPLYEFNIRIRTYWLK